MITEYLKDKTIFDDIDRNNATIEYVRLIKEYAEGLPPLPPTKAVNRFLLESKDAWSAVYTIDPATAFMKKPVWRSTDRAYFIFYSGSAWILTTRQYETGLSATTGGYASTFEEYPYSGGWNQPCTIRVLD